MTRSLLAVMVALVGVLGTTAWRTPPRTTPVSFPLLHAEQLLAGLHYLPVQWHPLVAATVETNSAAWAHPPLGHWAWTPEPMQLHILWTAPGTMNPLVAGGLIAIQHRTGLPISGHLTPATAQAINTAWIHHQTDPHKYTYVLVNEYSGSLHPETLTLWHNGRVALRTLVNTGVSQSPSPIGTWPVYLRYRAQDMSGYTPWGTYYNDPGVPYVNYFHGGDAVHGFPRAAYGFPQSLGCVELPIPNAALAWTWIHYGTPVTVTANLTPTLRAVVTGGPVR